MSQKLEPPVHVVQMLHGGDAVPYGNMQYWL